MEPIGSVWQRLQTKTCKHVVTHNTHGASNNLSANTCMHFSIANKAHADFTQPSCFCFCWGWPTERSTEAWQGPRWTNTPKGSQIAFCIFGCDLYLPREIWLFCSCFLFFHVFQIHQLSFIFKSRKQTLDRSGQFSITLPTALHIVGTLSQHPDINVTQIIKDKMSFISEDCCARWLQVLSLFPDRWPW